MFVQFCRASAHVQSWEQSCRISQSWSCIQKRWPCRHAQTGCTQPQSWHFIPMKSWNSSLHTIAACTCLMYAMHAVFLSVCTVALTLPPRSPQPDHYQCLQANHNAACLRNTADNIITSRNECLVWDTDAWSMLQSTLNAAPRRPCTVYAAPSCMAYNSSSDTEPATKQYSAFSTETGSSGTSSPSTPAMC